MTQPRLVPVNSERESETTQGGKCDPSQFSSRSGMAPDYAAFLAGKAPAAVASGIEPGEMPGHLFDFQAACVAFALRQGRAGLFLDTGMGKTRAQLEWCRQSADASNGCALILTPLAVARQIEREALALGYAARVVREASDVAPGINVCNYDRLDRLDSTAFGAVSLDEADILCNFAGATSRALKAAFASTRFRLVATATPAPNDPTEIAEHAEFLGIMNRGEMLQRWFINDTDTASQQWRLKGHAVQSFYDWMASWARMAETPADLGCDASRYVLPPLSIHRHRVASAVKAADGELFSGPISATDMHAVKRQTAEARSAEVARLVDAEPDESWLIWCDTDAEAVALRSLISGAVEVRGSHTPEQKEDRLLGFASGGVKRLITKPAIASAGLNFQVCARMAFVGRTFSYRAWYQAVRRSWRFGQTRPVHVHVIVAEGEEQIGAVVERKGVTHAAMKEAMRQAMARDTAERARVKVAYEPRPVGSWAPWLKTVAS